MCKMTTFLRQVLGHEYLTMFDVHDIWHAVWWAEDLESRLPKLLKKMKVLFFCLLCVCVFLNLECVLKRMMCVWREGGSENQDLGHSSSLSCLFLPSSVQAYWALIIFYQVNQTWGQRWLKSKCKGAKAIHELGPLTHLHTSLPASQNLPSKVKPPIP